MPAAMWSRVLFPLPERPATETVSPDSIFRLTESRTVSADPSAWG